MKIILTKLFTTLHCQRNKSATSRIFAIADLKKVRWGRIRTKYNNFFWTNKQVFRNKWLTLTHTMKYGKSA